MAKGKVLQNGYQPLQKGYQPNNQRGYQLNGNQNSSNVKPPQGGSGVVQSGNGSGSSVNNQNSSN